MKAMRGSHKFAEKQRPAILAAAAFVLVCGESAWTQEILTCSNPLKGTYPNGVTHHCITTRYLKQWIAIADFTYGYDKEGFTIFLPAEYSAPANASKRYPVVYYLDGVGGGTGSDLPYGPIAKMISDSVNAGKITPFIYVWVEAGGGGMYGEWGDNCPVSGDCNNDSSDSHVTKELVPYIDANYRTIASKSGRSIEGFSMGGSGCLRFAYKYPGMYASVVSYACSIYPGDYSRGMPTYPIKQSKADNIDYCKYNQDSIRGKVGIWLRAGSDDPGNIWNQYVHSRFLDSLNIPHSVDTIKGAPHEPVPVYTTMQGSKGMSGMAGFRFHAAHWNLSSTSTQSEVNRATLRQTPPPKYVVSLQGCMSQSAKGSAPQRVFDIRGNLLGSKVTRTASRQSVGVRVVQGVGM